MRQLAFAVLAFCAFQLAPLPAAADDMNHGVTAADKLTWMPYDPAHPEGIQLAVLYGDPSKAGPFGLRLKIPANLTIPSHTHSNTEYVTVVSGKAMVSWGMGSDVMKGDTLMPGSFFWMKGGDHHTFMSMDETVVELHSTGPFDMVIDK
jgi:hypothetical protein